MQNIYDNDMFFNEYIALRETDNNYNNLLEQPAMMNLLPDLMGKTVLDLGCGFGSDCKYFAENGAEKVIGVDISKNMINLAKKNNSDEKIEYINMSMSEISSLKDTFDLVYSSLAFHYVENFEGLMNDIFHLLNRNGTLLFSQEHPIVTCSVDDSNYYIKDEKGTPCSYVISDYSIPGKRKTFWYVDGVEKYHRTFSQIINTVINTGFTVEKAEEPLPSESAISQRKGLEKEFIKPSFLIIKAIKK